VFITRAQRVLQQSHPAAVLSMRRIDANQRQMPMPFGRVIPLHLLNIENIAALRGSETVSSMTWTSGFVGR
jgi:hypothetical protein